MIFKCNFENLSNRHQLPILSAIVAITYYFSAQFGLSLSFKPDYIAALWPPNAILLSALLLAKPKNWVWFLLAIVPAELAADLPSGISLKMSIGFILSDWIEVLVAASLFRKFSLTPPDFSSIRQTTIYITCCVIIAPFIAAFPGAVITGFNQAGPDYLTRWFRWFTSDGLTHLLVTPFIVLWLCKVFPQTISKSLSYYLELFALSTILIITGGISLSGVIFSIETSPALLYAPLPFLLWSAVRFGPRSLFSFSLFIAVVCIWASSKGLGPFTVRSPAGNVINLQLYLIITLTPLIFLAALIKDQKRTNELLKTSEEKFRTLSDTSPMAISIVGVDKYLYVNSSWEQLTGYSKKEAETLNPLMVVHPDVRDKVLKNAKARLNGEQFKARYEMKGLNKKGEVIWYDFTVAAIQYDNQPALLCLKPDITDRKKAESLLKEREEQYRSLFENNVSVILLIDPDNGSIFGANPSACSYYGYSREEITKLNIADINNLSKEELWQEMEKAKTEKRSYFNFQHRLSNNEIRDVEVYSGPITLSSRSLLCSIVHDVSERKSAENERDQLINKLQKALKELKTLRGIIPICSSCKNIRDDKGYWRHVESYISAYSDAEFSHSICPECADKLYGDQGWYQRSKLKKNNN